MKQFIVYDSKNVVKDAIYIQDGYNISSVPLPYGTYRICERKIKMDRKTKKQLKKALLMMLVARQYNMSVSVKTHYINGGTQEVEFYRKPRIRVRGGKLKFYKER